MAASKGGHSFCSPLFEFASMGPGSPLRSGRDDKVSDSGLIFHVMAGLDPAIQSHTKSLDVLPWMAASEAAMTSG
jgi:hypothetical protein